MEQLAGWIGISDMRLTGTSFGNGAVALVQEPRITVSTFHRPSNYGASIEPLDSSLKNQYFKYIKDYWGHEMEEKKLGVRGLLA